MVFSSNIFLFLFLPIVLAVYFALPGIRLKNLWLLGGSVIFYAWGEPVCTFLMLASVGVNWGLGLWLDGAFDYGARKRAVVIAVVFNIGMLVFFKYANFIVQNLNVILRLFGFGVIDMPPVRLPIGISFFTFHAISYILDIFSGKSKAARNPTDVALYIFFFPQLIAGPILRWGNIAAQIAHRIVTLEHFGDGIRRFIYGLAKKVLIANSVAMAVDKLFFIPPENLTPASAWLGVFCYTLQIYFDFSGYSDMAIGLGKMFGFDFMENFRHPYAARSVRDFWRGWHISLSTWFRDYLYVPLGGNRCSTIRNHINLLTVFFLCGLWHGASWTFVVWGIYHGFFLVLERTQFGTWVERMPGLIRHSYTLLVVAIGWAIFRADTLQQAQTLITTMFNFQKAMQSEGIKELNEAVTIVFGLSTNRPTSMLGTVMTSQVVWAVLAGVLFAIPSVSWSKIKLKIWIPQTVFPLVCFVAGWVEVFFLAGLFIVSNAWLAVGTYNPFIYFRF